MYYEWDNSIWIRESGKGGRIKCFCLGGKHRGRKWLMSKDEFSEFRRIRNRERIEELFNIRMVKGAPLSLQMR
jgi:hypothetical protein